MRRGAWAWLTWVWMDAENLGRERKSWVLGDPQPKLALSWGQPIQGKKTSKERNWRQSRELVPIPQNTGIAPITWKLRPAVEEQGTKNSPGGPVVKAPCFPYGGHRLDAWPGN